MYIKSFPRGEGCGSGPVDYSISLVDPRTGELRSVAPVVIKGDPENTRRLIDSISRKWKYTSGVCSWAPGEVVTPQQEREFIAEFEAVAFAGLESDQADALWVRHQHADHHELHFIIPRMELTTGKAMNAFAPGWQKDFDPLRDKWNIANDWARPDDPARSRLLQPGALAQYSGDKKEIIAAVHAYVLHEVTEGRVNNRSELVASLNEAGLEVTREGKAYVTITDETGARHRLKGAIYGADFDRQRFIATSESQDGAEPAGSREDRQRQLEELDRELEQIRAKRSEYNQGRYQKADGSHRADIKPGNAADPGRGQAAPEATPPLAGRAVSLGDHLRKWLGDDALASIDDRPGSGGETGGDHDHERNSGDSQKLGPGSQRNTAGPLPDLSPGAADPDRLHAQGRQSGSEDNSQIKGDHSHAKPNIAKPGFSPPPQARGRLRSLSECGMVHDPRPDEMLLPRDVPCHVRQLRTDRDCDELRRPDDRPGLTKAEREQYKQTLVQKLLGSDQTAKLWSVKWVDQGGSQIDFKDGSRLLIGDKEHTAKGMSDGLAAKRLIASNKAAGWTRIGITGPNRFVKLAALEALKNGIEPVATNPKQARLVEQVRKDFERDAIRKAVDRSTRENADRAQRTNRTVESTSENLELAGRRVDECKQRINRDLKPRLEAAMTNELDEMKQINIADYVVAQGYALNKPKSSKNALCYDHSNGDRIIVGTDAKSGHSVYYSVRDDNDNGTIIDLIQKRQALNLGQVRKELRPWIGRGPAERPEIQPQPKAAPTTKDRAAQARGLAACEPVGSRHKYLESRAISSETLRHFQSRVYTDARGNAIFPHFDSDGVSGLEIKNTKFTGFSKAGQKGLWLHGPADPARVVVTESAIDAMSHYQLDQSNPQRNQTLYVSTAGKMSPEAKANLQALIDKHPGAEIVAGFDNDGDGDRFTGELQEMASEREIVRHKPQFKDWNDQLQELRRRLEEKRQRELDDKYHGPRM